MAAIELHDGSSFHELRRADGSVHSWIRRGFYGPPEYRGEDDVIPGAAGFDVGEWEKAQRIIEIGQQIKGSGATEAAAQAAFLVLADELRVLYESTYPTPRELRVHTPLYGIASGYRKCNVRWLNSIESDPIGGFQQVLTVRFICIDSPPDWVAVP
jgi:hypothetical protein